MPAPVNYHKGTNSINALVATPNGYNFAPAGLSNPNTNPNEPLPSPDAEVWVSATNGPYHNTFFTPNSYAINQDNSSLGNRHLQANYLKYQTVWSNLQMYQDVPAGPPQQVSSTLNQCGFHEFSEDVSRSYISIWVSQPGPGPGGYAVSQQASLTMGTTGTPRSLGSTYA